MVSRSFKETKGQAIWQGTIFIDALLKAVNLRLKNNPRPCRVGIACGVHTLPGPLK